MDGLQFIARVSLLMGSRGELFMCFSVSDSFLTGLFTDI